MQKVTVGLIKGRHELPVERYLLAPDDGNVNFATAHKDAYDAATLLAHEYGMRPMVYYAPRTLEVDLYVTGLTRAVLGALAGFADYCVRVNLFEFNAAAQGYESAISMAGEWSDFKQWELR